MRKNIAIAGFGGNLRIAFYATVPFQLRTLKPISTGFKQHLISFDSNETILWRPEVIVVSAEHELPLFRSYCDKTGCLLIGLRHSAGCKYVLPPKEYSLADYICGSEWDEKDFERAGIKPRKGFLYTGNPWVDEVFTIGKRELNTISPTILFAPTWNPDTSAAKFFEGTLIERIREVFPISRIIIRPHPNILTYNHKYLVKFSSIYKRWISYWNDAACESNVSFIDDPELALPQLYKEADIMISDASTAIFEFMILNRPILLYTAPEKPDVRDYDSQALGNKNRNVGIEFSDSYSFNEALRNAFKEHNLRCSLEQRKLTEELFGNYNDGNSYIRVIKALREIHGNKSIMEESKLKITKNSGDGSKLISIDSESDFASSIKELFNKIKPLKSLETGTYLGQGTTRIISQTLKDLNLNDAVFHTIEVNPDFYLKAFENLLRENLLGYVKLHNGLSIPRNLLPTCEEIEKAAINNVEYESIFIDHDTNERVKKYYNETDFKNVDDNLLDKCLAEFNYAPDFVLLDSAGHMGHIEFNYLINKLEKDCYICLDDVFHFKHYKSLQQIQSDSRFEIIKLSKEKFGFCLVKFKVPLKSDQSISVTVGQKSVLPENIVAIGLVEHMGDIIACEPISRYIRKKYPESYIVWVTSEKYKELIDSNPNINETYTVNCLTEWIMLKESKIFSEVIDLHIQDRVCPGCNMPLKKDKGRADITLENYYNFGNLLSVFTQCAGLPILNETPRVYISAQIQQQVNSFNLPDEFIVFHCLSNEITRDWQDDKWISLAHKITERYKLPIIEIGHKSVLANDKKLIFRNLCNNTTILQTAEIIRRARLFVGVDSSAAHLANAVGTYGIILLGIYRAFERYIPYSGNFENGNNSEIIYSNYGPASNIPVNAVLFAVEKSLKCKLENKPIIPGIKRPKENLVREFIKQRDIRLLSIYLPQFHPIPENDRWWGKGFTEWTNVAKSKPLFPGHYQPHLPSDLGFYDLRVPETRLQQAELASEYGIEGFCYYHYWFNGKRLLEKPFNEVLKTGEPDFPFCLIWANENWTKRWDGREKEMLQEQTYGGPEDILSHFLYILKAFVDKRYVRIKNKPVFMIYRPSGIPDIEVLINMWRFFAERAGLDGIYLVALRTGFENLPKGYWQKKGFDNELIFQPGTGKVNKLNVSAPLSKFGGGEHVSTEAIVIDYERAWNIMKMESEREDNTFACVVPSWDSSPRRAKIGAYILHNSNPDSYHRWLSFEIKKVLHREFDERLVVLNAWNEWAEGNHLEPDQQYGCAYLESTKKAINESTIDLARIELLKNNSQYCEILLKRGLMFQIRSCANNFHAENITNQSSRHKRSEVIQNKNLAEIYFLLSLLKFRLQDVKSSIEYLELALKFNGNHVLAAFLKAEIHFLNKDQRSITIVYQRLFENNISNAIVLGDLIYRLGVRAQIAYSPIRGKEDYVSEENVRLFKLILSEFGLTIPTADQVYAAMIGLQKAKENYYSKNYLEAVKIFESIYSIIPDSLELLQHLALTKIELNDRSAALEYAKKAVLQNNNDSVSLRIFARTLIINGNTSEAMQIYRMLILKNPTDTDLLIEIAEVEVRYKNYPEAASILEKTLEIDPLNYTAKEIMLSLKEQGLVNAGEEK